MAHQSNTKKMEMMCYAVGTLSGYLQAPDVFQNVKEKEEVVENIVDMLLKVYTDTPLQSSIGIRFSQKTKPKRNCPKDDEAITQFGIYDIDGEGELADRFPSGIMQYMMDMIWTMMNDKNCMGVLKARGAQKLIELAKANKKNSGN